MNVKKYMVLILLLIGCLYVTDRETVLNSHGETGEKSDTQEVVIPVYYHKGMDFVPQASGTRVEENEDVLYDISHIDQGYMMVKKKLEGMKMLLQLTGQDGVTYTYRLNEEEEYAVIPLTAGDGDYQATTYINVEGSQYLMSLDKTLQVKLENEVIPFLYPSQYVNFDSSMDAVKLAAELTKDKTETEAVTAVFQYVTENVKYDYEKAETVETGYLPVIDQTLKEGKGICFDYASLMTAMLRSAGIPTKLDIGFSQDVYHAWISVYFSEHGWMNNVMEYNGEEWNLMDPTQASSDYENGEDYEINDQDYILEYVH